MDVNKYLSELEKDLKGISAVDRQNILAYYNEYLIDAQGEAGAAEQFDASNVLGSPKALAKQIKADIAMAPLLSESMYPAANTVSYQQTAPGQTTAQQASDTQAFNNAALYGENVQKSANPYSTPYGHQQYVPKQAQSFQATPEKEKSSLKIILIVILAILAIPVGIPLAIALFALIFSVLACLFLFLLALAAVSISFCATGILATIVGIILLFTNPPVGLFYIGIGLLALGLFILVAVAFTTLSSLAVQGVAKMLNAIRVKLSNRKKVAM